MKIHGMVLIAAAAFVVAGCANRQLRFSTAQQASTMTEVQYKQILNNLAMFSLDPYVIPSFVLIKTGTTQVSDQGTGVAAAAPTYQLSVSRSVVDSWANIPVTDDTTIKLLRKAFQRALGMPSELNMDEANELAHILSAQIGTNADISIDKDTIGFLVSNQAKKPADATPPAGKKGERTAGPLEKASVAIDDELTSTLDEQILVEIDANKKNLKGPYFKPDKPLATGLAKSAIYQVNQIQEILKNIPSGWFHVGGKRDVPKCACYVGKYCSCNRDCYVWVEEGDRAQLADFTIAILRLSTAVKDVQAVSVSSGIQYSPVMSTPR